VLWAVYGYSLAFGGEGLIIARLRQGVPGGVTPTALADTFSADVKLPEYVFIAFQATFAASPAR
jgi:ammonium transporter, Amt family